MQKQYLACEFGLQQKTRGLKKDKLLGLLLRMPRVCIIKKDSSIVFELYQNPKSILIACCHLN